MNGKALKRLAAALTAIGAFGGSAGAPHTWWSGPQVTLLGSPSPDGRHLSFVDPATGALGVRDLADASWRAIAKRPPGSREFAYFSVFSRDGRKVAYAWMNSQGFYDLRVANADGAGEPVIAYHNEEAGFVQPCAWTPDGKEILTLLFRRDNISQIVLAPEAGGAPRVLRSLDWVYPKKMDLSPDGRWIVYDNFAQEGKPQRTIFILSTDGREERKLIDKPGDYLFPQWSPDGRRVIFTGDNGGPDELWSIGVENGRAQGAPRRIAGSLGRILPLGITRTGDFFYGLRTGGGNIYVAELSGAGPAARKLPTRFIDRNTAPAWSRDGKRLAYLSRRGTENFGADAHTIVVRDMASGAERELPGALAEIDRITWSPDGSTLLASGSDGKGRGGLFLVRVSDGETTPLVAERGAPYTGFEAVWAPDGHAIYYLRGASDLLKRDVADGKEEAVLHADRLSHLAIDPAGDILAVGIGDAAVRLTPLRGTAVARLIPFPGLTDLAWGRELYAGRGPQIWAVPLDGSAPRRVMSAAGRLPGASLSPDGKSFAFAAGSEQSAVLSFPLPKL